MIDDNNLPVGLPSNFNNEPEPIYKRCPDCGGLGVDSEDGIDISACISCNGTGETEMSEEEIKKEEEAKKEPKNL